MLPFTLIDQADTAGALEKLGPARDLDVLVLYYGELARRAFLGKILGAAGYTDPGTQLHLLEWPADQDLDLSTLVRSLNVNKVMLFGYTLPRLGLHLEVANYFPLTVAGTTYLIADSLDFIEDAKAGGDNRAAGALWTAVKGAFLKIS
ncbi:hypothetical protein LEM8419_00794 [Neolewinella maritima]|uniref:Uncharacterized protein n=1 Tax=Neolewinella maritima TaxID=1383882 RepID=A0ABM9AXQ5_9BACT|nr:hypothetical protein [Neolewinella maritima]CAH0999494.1 hypothetical protein LEM8419_00794 [Neolewinella maritima]